MQQGDGTSRQKLLIYSDEGVLAAGAASVVGSIPELNIRIAGQDLAALIPAAKHIVPELILPGLTAGMTVGFLNLLRQAVSGARIILWDREISDELSDNVQEFGNCWFCGAGVRRRISSIISRGSRTARSRLRRKVRPAST